MNGLKLNGVTLFLGKLPGRKQECFYFLEEGGIFPVAYIRKQLLKDTQKLWARMLGEEVEK